MGPWTHGGWSRGEGDTVGPVSFGTKTAECYREHVEFPFFARHLKGAGGERLPEALMFETGLNEWRRYDTWPPKAAQARTLYLGAAGRSAWQAPATADGFDEYVSDPNKPVPLVGYTAQSMPSDYMTDDQRFAAQRPDVLVYQTPPLTEDLTVAGPDRRRAARLDDRHRCGLRREADRRLSGRLPVGRAAIRCPRLPVKMGGYQQLVRGEPFRGKFRNSFEKPEPFVAGSAGHHHASRCPTCTTPSVAGHRVMVQVQSSWFPLVDRNPQTFVDITKATEADFKTQTHRVYRSAARGSSVTVRVEP